MPAVSSLYARAFAAASALKPFAFGMLALGGFSVTGHSSGMASAQTVSRISSNLPGFDLVPALPLGIFAGAVSFALLSAFWLIREKARAGEENTELKISYAGIRAERDRMAALTEAGDQRIVVWDNSGDRPKVFGSLGDDTGLPRESGSFLAFGSWLAPESATRLETALRGLREDARQFTLTLKASAGAMVEAQGRVSGGFAFVRFLPLDGVRSDLARIRDEHAGLQRRFSVLETLFENMPSPFWIANGEGRLAYANPAYASAVEADSADAAIAADKPLFDSKERETIRQSLEKAPFFRASLPAVVAGDRLTMDTAIAANANGMAGLAIDRSDVEAVKATLKHTIASHQQTFDHLATAVAIFDARQRLQFHNSSFQQLWGLSQSDLDGHPSNSDLLEMLRSKRRLPEAPDWRKWKEGLLSAYHSTEAREENWHLPDGRTLRVIVNPQNVGGTSWVFENVTEELALKSNYNSLMRMQGETLDHLSEAVAVFGPDGRVRLTNPAFLALWDIATPEEIEGSHIKELSGKLQPLLADAKLWDRIRLEVTSVQDDRADQMGRLELRNGTILDYHLVFLPAGQSMLTLADMTAAANIERALKERNDALEESGALKNRFLQHVSYELRAPLTSIAGFSEMLASDMPGKLNAKQREYLDYIAQSSDVLKALIDDILDLATIDAGAMVLDMGSVDFGKVISECLSLQADALERFRLKVSVEADPAANGMIGDANRIGQILQNLIANAAQAAPDGSQITIRTAKTGDAVELSVEDEGPGIPEEMRTTIFERFESGMKGNRGRGAGLGLALVRSLVELHGGSVFADEGRKRGARIVCLLPFTPPASRQAAE